MRLTPRRWRSTTSCSWHDQEYEQQLSEPCHHFVTIVLSRAIELGAEAICFGFRPDIVEAAQGESCCGGCGKPPAVDEEAYARNIAAVEQSASARGPSGKTGLPVSFSIGGALRHFLKQPSNTYGMILAAFQFRPVAIGASEAQPQPLRYIEIGYGMSKHPATSHPLGRRRFVEVDLEFKQDNTFWVHLRGQREVEPSVRVSRTIC